MQYERLTTAARSIQMPDDVRERILHSVENPQSQRSIAKTTARKALVMAAAAVLILTLCGFSYVLLNKYTDFFADYSGQELTQSQKDFIDENFVGIGQSATVGDYTVTVESALCDSRTLYITVRIEAPKGERIDFGGQGYSVNFDRMFVKTTSDAAITGDLESGGYAQMVLEDDDGKENTVSVVIREHRIYSPDSNFTYTDGAIWTFQLTDLYKRQRDYPYENILLQEGTWNFAFPLTESSEERELLSEPFICTMRQGGIGVDKTPFDVSVTSLMMRNFGMEVRFRFFPDHVPVHIPDPLMISVVMKDGHTVETSPKAAYGNAEWGEDGMMAYTFDEPVVLDEVDYLLLPDDVKIYPTP